MTSFSGLNKKAPTTGDLKIPSSTIIDTPGPENLDSAGPARLLVVDDESIITTYLEELLTKFGYNIVGTASTGLEGIKMAGELKPDLILMDIIMPGEKSGIDAAMEIKEKYEIPVIFLTAFGEEQLVAKSKLSDPFAYIMKPFKNQELKAAIDLALYKMNNEKKLRESEEKYRNVVEGSRDGIGIVQNGIFKYINPALFDLLGRPNDISDKQFVDFIAGESNDETNKKNLNLLIENESEDINELTILRPDSTEIPIEINGSKINYSGEPANLFFFRNIAEKRYIEQLFEYQVNDINECNQIVISSIEKVLGELNLEAQKKELRTALSVLFRNANSFMKIYKIFQLKEIKKELKYINIIDSINGSVNNIIHQFPDKEISINTSIKGALSQILSDDLIEDVFFILFDNSINNTEGGKIEINIRLNEKYIRNKKFLEISIEDKSKGIPDKEKNNILRQFRVNGYDPALGLNLSIIRLILNRYSAKIEIKDRIAGDYKRGCVYKILIPIFTN